MEELKGLQYELRRIATALEESNRISREWIAVQVIWHDEDIGPELLDIHRQHAAHEAQHMARLREIAEDQARRQQQSTQDSYLAFIASLEGKHG